MSVGQVLRAYRGSRSQQAVADAVGRSQATVSEWETDVTAVPYAALAAIDRLTRAGGGLVDLVTAMGVTRLDVPAREWRKNFPDDQRPCWMWLRPAKPSSLSALLSWGPFFEELQREVPADGLIVTTSTSFANPFARVTMLVDGRVDFGVGVVPPDLGPQIVRGEDLVGAPRQPWWRVGNEEDRALQPAFRTIQIVASRIGLRPAVLRPYLSSLLPSVTPLMVRVASVEPADLDRRPLWAAARWRAEREAHGYSRTTLAHVATEHLRDAGTRLSVSEAQVERLEKGVVSPRPEFLPALDSALRADGMSFVQPVDDLAMVQLAQSNSPSNADVWAVRFPSFWIGPVWVAVTQQDIITIPVELYWRPWRRRLNVPSGAVLGFRQSTLFQEPVHVTVPAATALTAGIGCPPEAIDVNEGWTPASARDLFVLTKELAHAVTRRIARRARRNV